MFPDVAYLDYQESNISAPWMFKMLFNWMERLNLYKSTNTNNILLT